MTTVMSRIAQSLAALFGPKRAPASIAEHAAQAAKRDEDAVNLYRQAAEEARKEWSAANAQQARLIQTLVLDLERARSELSRVHAAGALADAHAAEFDRLADNIKSYRSECLALRRQVIELGGEPVKPVLPAPRKRKSVKKGDLK